MRAKYNIKTISTNSETIWKQLRWSQGVVTCPVCGCQEIYHIKDGRYKCKHCKKVFSDRTGTLLQGSKLPIWIWLTAIFKFSICQEFSAIDLSKLCSISYPTAYMMLQKLRYVSGMEKVSLYGMIRIDESYLGAWQDMHFNKKIEFMKKNGFMDPEATRYDKTKILRASSAKKFHTLSITDEQNNNVLLHCPNPITKTTIKSILMRELGVTGIVSDESGLYRDLGIPVYQSNHSRHIFVSPEGYSSNVCENRFSWVKRKWNGTYTHTSEKYLQLYLWQRQWHYNHKGDSNDRMFVKMASLCIKHRITEKTIRNFNYKSRYPRSRREIEADQCRELMSHCGGIISSVTDSYGREYR